MEKILVVAQGNLAVGFLKRLFENRSNQHYYTIISNVKESDFNNNSDYFKFYNFDPTSFSKISAIVKDNFSQFIIFADDKKESLEIYKNLRNISKKTEIILLSLWGVVEQDIKNDKYTKFIDAKDILSSIFIRHLPNMPILADNIGLGEGEIMEVKVPVGSSYMYRHLSSIQQRKWRIALIYRQNDIILPKNNTMILPNDTLIIVGDPNVLRNVFRSIKLEKGQFPNPFGNNIYTFIDMKAMNEKEIKKLIDNSLYLNSKLSNRRLIFKIINPTLGDNLNRIVSKISDKNISYNIDYYTRDNSHIVGDVVNFDIGLVITSNNYFFKFKKLFHSLALPILKIGNSAINNIKQGVIFGDSKMDIENQSAVILDCCSQLDISIELHYFDDNVNEDDTLAEHFDSISALFNKNIEIKKYEEKNPILHLSEQDDLLHFVSFDEYVSRSDSLSLFSNTLNRQYKMLKDNSQLFIPAVL
ncbi:COG3400 family protein [Campylobacter pinnipediorum]|uniref:Potassium transporter TrkA n=1 Tax=Campylobacter pinnipediorum subsp. pinnipediorum TaxID=1660067 RepID=A0AAX0LB32_9BACT|nr:TrkA C-terminal domain-containing protein [Campylobacter pinnipediorum]AQW81013.1 putative TrkA domain protein [Campylobacter pinnipediorum subsp. pinnipediorum]AQW82629.1 putative TrkA domain protein [Campylobacter pinnipediorum subsp. pinnipediorum]AQW84315.1 putative TrkA domain protein [Campylobacter pinnipediorum subsp. pinnipediorum]OPA78915.1 potassium transporter TrkA [Campylobacter pinnipediorum subsp. pinnipediorum]